MADEFAVVTVASKYVTSCSSAFGMRFEKRSSAIHTADLRRTASLGIGRAPVESLDPFRDRTHSGRRRRHWVDPITELLREHPLMTADRMSGRPGG